MARKALQSEKMVGYHITLTQTLRDRTDQYAQANDLSRSQVIRRALGMFLDGSGEQ